MAVTPEPVTAIQAVLFGLVQGLTEFLPISSTAHLRILPELIGRKTDPGAAFTAVIQLGTVAAVIIYFAKDLWAAFMGWVRSFTGPKDTPEARMGWAVVIGTIPIVILGVLLRHQIKSEAVRSLYVIAFSMIAMGLVMLAAERMGKKERNIKQVSMKDGLIVGLWQCIALIPGMSRSGSTISGALFAGFDRPTAARFSFLLSVPAVAAAGFYEFFDERKNIMGENLTPAIIATLVAFVVGYASIAWLIKYLQKHGIGIFVIYRIALGILLLVLIQAGVLRAQAENTDEATAPETHAAAPSPKPVDAMAARLQAWHEAMQQPQGTNATAKQAIVDDGVGDGG